MSHIAKAAVCFGGACLLAVIFNERSGAGGETRPFSLLPERIFFSIAAKEADFIKSALANGRPDKETTRAVRAAAWRVAASAEVGLIYKGKFTQEFGSLATLGLHNIRHDAMVLVQAIDKGDYDRAKKLVSHLTPGYPKSDPSVKISAASVAKAIPVRDAMLLFSNTSVGGGGLEAQLDEFGKKEKLIDDDLTRLEVIGYRIRVLAQLADNYLPQEEQGAKSAKAWLAFASDFRNASTHMTEAAVAKNATDTRLWLRKLTGSCVQCHDVFRK